METDYEIILSEKEVMPNGDILYMARIKNLFGCMAQGETEQEAIDNVITARFDYLADSAKDSL